METIAQLLSFIAQKIPVSVFRGVSAANLKSALNEIVNFFGEKIDAQNSYVSYPNDGSITESHIDRLAMQVMDGETAQAALAQTTIVEGQEHVLPPILGRIAALKDGNVLVEPPSQMTKVTLASEDEGGTGYTVLETFIYNEYLVAWRDGTVIKYDDFVIQSGFTPEEFNVNEGEVFARLCQLFYGLENGDAGDKIMARVVPDATATSNVATPPVVISTDNLSFVILQSDGGQVIFMEGWMEESSMEDDADVIFGMIYYEVFGRPLLVTKGLLSPELAAEEFDEDLNDPEFWLARAAIVTEAEDEVGSASIVLKVGMASFVSKMLHLGSCGFAGLNAAPASAQTGWSFGIQLPSGWYIERWVVFHKFPFVSPTDISAAVFDIICINGESGTGEQFGSTLPNLDTDTPKTFVRAPATLMQEWKEAPVTIQVMIDFSGIPGGVNPQDFTNGELLVSAIIRPFVTPQIT